MPQVQTSQRNRRAPTAPETKKGSGRLQQPGIVRYFRGKGGATCYYAAQIQLGEHLRLLSKTELHLEDALRHHEELQRIRHATSTGADFENQFREALLATERPGSQQTGKGMGLRFVVSVRPCFSERRLASPPYRIDTLEMGIRALRRLTAAAATLRRAAHRGHRRGRADLSPAAASAAWCRLREAYLVSIGEYGRNLGQARRRLNSLEAEFQQRYQRDLCRSVRQGTQRARRDPEDLLKALLSRWQLAEQRAAFRCNKRHKAVYPQEVPG